MKPIRVPRELDSHPRFLLWRADLVFVCDLGDQAAGFEFFVNLHENFLLELGGKGYKTPPAKCEIWQRAKNTRYHLCSPAPRGGGPSRVQAADATDPIPRRCNVRTRPSLLPPKRGFGRLLRGVFAASCAGPFHQPEPLSRTKPGGYLSPSLHFIALIVACWGSFVKRRSLVPVHRLLRGEAFGITRAQLGKIYAEHGL